MYFRQKYPVTTHFSGLIIPVTNYSLLTILPRPSPPPSPAKWELQFENFYPEITTIQLRGFSGFRAYRREKYRMQGSSTSFDGPSVFSISSLNLTIKERNEGRWEERRGREGEGRGGEGRVGRAWAWDEVHTYRMAVARRRIWVPPKGEPAFHFLSRRFCARSIL